MASPTLTRSSIAFVSLLFFGCGGGNEESERSLEPLPETCETDSDCDDGNYCNGQEFCLDAGDGLTCVYGQRPCQDQQVCREAAESCSTNCGLTNDADKDGSVAAECGGDDCDDSDANRFPGNREVCDEEGHDEDCDLCTVAEGSAEDGDADRDGHLDSVCSNSFDPDGLIPFCSSERVELHGEEGLVSGRDCNDENAAIRPGANESCNGVDDDCDGELDNGLRQTDYYPDCDRDGQGDGSTAPTPSCAIPAKAPESCSDGTWEEDDNRDCDDNSASIFVGAPELCDGVDNNCNGLFEALDPDNDGYSSCEGPLDCDNNNPLIHPGAEEELDGIDNDCNGFLDAPGEDDDRDGSASPLAGGLDCDDDNADAWPGGPPAMCELGVSYACSEEGQVVLHEKCQEPSRQSCEVGGCLGVAERVFVGYRNTCAILIDGALKCWGNSGNVLGQQDGAFEHRGSKPFRMGDSLHAIPLGDGVRPVEVVLSVFNACALLNNGQVKCWGRDEELHLSDAQHGSAPDSLGDSLPALEFGGGRLVTQLVGGGAHFCALLDDQSVKCWGVANRGQLGTGGDSTSASTDMSSDETTVNLGAGMRAVHLGLGSNHSCAILEGGAVKCWGSNDYGELGLGIADSAVGLVPSEMGDELPTVDLGPGRAAVDISGGLRSTCALMEDGDVLCWGAESLLGRADIDENVGDDPGEMGQWLVPVDLGTDKAVVRLESSDDYHCAFFEDGTVKCWGNNQHGSLGVNVGGYQGDSHQTLGEYLQYSDLGGKLSDLSAGGGTTCGVLADSREVVCVGNNASGKCGAEVGGSIGKPLPYDSSSLKRVALGSSHKVTQISAYGGKWFGAVLSDGQVKTWGSGDVFGHGHSQGINTLEELTTTAPLELGGPAIQVVGTGKNACALLASGEVQCWGEHTSGVLGRDAPDMVGDQIAEMGDSLPIIPLGTFEGEALRALELVPGEGFVCALLEDATVKCWGHNFDGTLGIGNDARIGRDIREMGDALQRVDLGADARVKEVAVDGRRVCALLESNLIKCWGDVRGVNLSDVYPEQVGGSGIGDEAEELGDALAPISFPRPGVIERIVFIDGGLCALYEDGVLSCFGRWFDNGPADALELDFGVDSPVVDFARGENHLCVLLESGALTCFAANRNGELGLGSSGIGNAGIDVNLELGASTEFVGTNGWRPIIQIAAGGGVTCALQNNGRVKCWGENAWTSAGYLADAPYAGLQDTVLTDPHLGNEPNEMGIHLPDLNVTY